MTSWRTGGCGGRIHCAKGKIQPRHKSRDQEAQKEALQYRMAVELLRSRVHRHQLVGAKVATPAAVGMAVKHLRHLPGRIQHHRTLRRPPNHLRVVKRARVGMVEVKVMDRHR